MGDRKVTVRNLVAGVAELKVDGREVATLERSAGAPCAVPEGSWFAYPTPSFVEVMAEQGDRASHAVAHGSTRRKCVEAFMAWWEWRWPDGASISQD